MEQQGLMNVRHQLLLTAAVSALLSCGVGNVLLAVTESVLWPLILGVGWTVIAAVVTGLAPAVQHPNRARRTPHWAAAAAAPGRV